MTSSPILLPGGAGETGHHVAKRLDRAGLDAAGRFVRQAAVDGLPRVVLFCGRGVGGPGRELAVYDGQRALEEAVTGSGLDDRNHRAEYVSDGAGAGS